MSLNKRFYWLKLKEDFFKSKEMKKLRKIAGGDTYVIIYLKMQLISLRNDGKLYYDNIDDDFASELALELDEDVENVRVTVSFLEHCGLLECVSADEYFLTTIPDVTGSETASTIRSRKHRALQCNVDATSVQLECNKNATLEIEKEKELEIELESKEKRDTIDYQRVADMYNDTCVSFPRLSKLSDSRKKCIRARFNGGYDYEDFQRLFTKAEQSGFLKGANDRSWFATFDWLIKDGNMAKVLDGNYDGDTQNGTNGSTKPVYGIVI
jgi:predicted phage replisome organizer